MSGVASEGNNADNTIFIFEKISHNPVSYSLVVNFQGRKALVRADPAWTLRAFLDAVAHFFRQSYGYEPPVGAASDFLLLQKDGVDINYLDETLGSWFQSGCLVGVTEKPLLSKPTTTALAAPAYFPFQPQYQYQYPQNPFVQQKPPFQTSSYPAQQPVANPTAPQMPLYQYYQPPATQSTSPPPPQSLPKPTPRWADSPAPTPKKEPSLEQALVESIKACAGPEGWAFAATVGHRFKSSTGQNLHVISNTAVSAGWVEKRGSQKTIELRVVRAPGSKPVPSKPTPILSKPEPAVSKPIAMPSQIPAPASASQKLEQQKSLDASFADLLEVLTDRPEKEPEWLPVAKVAERLFHRTGGDLSKILPGAIETGVIELDAERERLRVRPGF